jgi:hypothetical protein
VAKTGCVALVGSRRGADDPALVGIALLVAEARRVALLGKDRATYHGAYTAVVVADATTLVAAVDRLDISAVARELAVWPGVADAEEGVLRLVYEVSLCLTFNSYMEVTYCTSSKTWEGASLTRPGMCR